MPGKYIEVKSNAGVPVAAGERLLIPIAQSVRVGPPGRPAGLIWNRPVAVVVQDPDGTQQVHVIQDVTRRFQIALLAAGVLGSLLAWLSLRQRANPS